MRATEYMRLDQSPTSVSLIRFYLTAGLVVRAFGEEPLGGHHEKTLGFRRSSRNVSLQTT